MPPFAFLECSRCRAHLSAETPQTVCTQCTLQPTGSLLGRYDLLHLGGTAADEIIARDAAGPWRGMYRYRSVLPDACICSSLMAVQNRRGLH
jgi:threonine synthase